MLLKLNVDTINKDKLQKAFSDRPYEDVYLLAHMRICIRGEHQTSDNKCQVCSDGFYTLKDNQLECYECPENAFCEDGYKIIPNIGYWRPNINSTDVYEC